MEADTMNGNFQKYVTDLKHSAVLVQDLVTNGQKLQHSLKNTVAANSTFLDSFQRVAEHAKSMQLGSTDPKSDVTSTLNTLVMRQKTIQNKMNNLSNMLLECFLQPLAVKAQDEWKRNAVTLEREHTKDFKRVSQEIKKMQQETLKLQKRVHKKNDVSCNDSQAAALQVALQDVSQRYSRLERSGRQSITACQREQAARMLTLITALSPLLESQLSLMAEVTQIQSVADDLAGHKEYLTGLVSGTLRIPESDVTNATQSNTSPPPAQASSGKALQAGTTGKRLGHRRQGSTGSNQTTSSSNDTSWTGTSSSTNNPTNSQASALAQQRHAGQRISSVSSRDSGFLSQESTHFLTTLSGMQSYVGSTNSVNNNGFNLPASTSGMDLLPPPPEDWINEQEQQQQPSSRPPPNQAIPAQNSPRRQLAVVQSRDTVQSSSAQAHHQPPPPVSRPPSYNAHLQKPPPPPKSSLKKSSSMKSAVASPMLQRKNTTASLGNGAAPPVPPMSQKSSLSTPRSHGHQSKTETLLRHKHKLSMTPLHTKNSVNSGMSMPPPATPPPPNGRAPTMDRMSAPSLPQTPNMQQKFRTSAYYDHTTPTPEHPENYIQRQSPHSPNVYQSVPQTAPPTQQHPQVPSQSPSRQPQMRLPSQTQSHPGQPSPQMLAALNSHLQQMNIESGTATIRRRTSTRITQSIVGGQIPYMMRRTPSVHSQSSVHLRHNSSSGGAGPHSQDDMFSVSSGGHASGASPSRSAGQRASISNASGIF